MAGIQRSLWAVLAIVLVVVVAAVFWPRSPRNQAGGSGLDSSDSTSGSDPSTEDPLAARSLTAESAATSVRPSLAFGSSNSLNSPEGFQASMKLLSDARLFADIPVGMGLLSGLTPQDGTKIEDAFGDLLREPTPEKTQKFLNVAKSELRERRLDEARTGAIEMRPEAAELRRQLLLRIVLGVEYARAAGGLNSGEADGALWELGAIPPPDIREETDLREAIDAMIDRRLAQTIEEESRWAAIPEDQLVDDLSSDSLSRHWVRGLLDIRMEAAALEQRPAEFEQLADRYLAIPEAGDPELRQRSLDARRARVDSFRQLLRSPG
jgi:hypothetical protein